MFHRNTLLWLNIHLCCSLYQLWLNYCCAIHLPYIITSCLKEQVVKSAFLTGFLSWKFVTLMITFKVWRFLFC